MEYLWQMQAHTYIQLTIFFTRVDPDSAGVIDWSHELHLGNLFDLTVSETIETLGPFTQQRRNQCSGISKDN